MRMFLAMCVFSYVAGSVNPAIIISRLIYKKDVRDFGDGNAGATNIFLHFGKSYGILVGIFDIIKGFLPVFIAAGAGTPENLLPIISVCTVLGHQYPLFHEFKGGTGIATTLGILLFFNKELAVISTALAITVSIAFHIGNLHFKTKFSAFETGEAAGFVLAFAYAICSADLRLKIFISLCLVLIIIKRFPEAVRFLTGKYLAK